MADLPLIASFTDFAQENWVSLILTLFLICLHLLVFMVAMPKLEGWVDDSNLKSGTLISARKVLTFISVTTLITLTTFVWGFDILGLMTVSASLIALLGVSLFAGWSLLSNMTAFILLIFYPPFQRGNYIRIINADNYVEGYISDITMFHTRLVTEDEEVIIYPNTQLLLNPSVVNPKGRYPSIGKITNFPTEREGKGNPKGGEGIIS